MIEDSKAQSYRWHFIIAIQGGHKIYREERSGRYSVCDYSGKLPHLTDDGVLWIDRERPLVHSDGKWGIPLLNHQEAKTSTLGSDEEAGWLVDNLQMVIEVGGCLFYGQHRIPMIPRKDNVGDVGIMHITMCDSLRLNKEIVPFHVGNYEYGHFVLTHPKDDVERSKMIREAGMSESFVRLLNIAYEQGYYYLMLDRDGPTVPGLDAFDW